jgi:hypothetical protein
VARFDFGQTLPSEHQTTGISRHSGFGRQNSQKRLFGACWRKQAQKQAEDFMPGIVI